MVKMMKHVEKSTQTFEGGDTLHSNNTSLNYDKRAEMKSRYPYVLYKAENEVAPDIDPEDFEMNEPELMEIFQISVEPADTKSRYPYVLYQGENEVAPEIDPADFEMDELELIEIFQNSKDTFTLLDNPCSQDLLNNTFLKTNPFVLKPTNPFKSLLNKEIDEFNGVSGDLKISVSNKEPTDESPNHSYGASDEFENSVASISILQEEEEFSPKVSGPKQFLKRKMNKFMSWVKVKCTFSGSPRYLKLK